MRTTVGAGVMGSWKLRKVLGPLLRMHSAWNLALLLLLASTQSFALEDEQSIDEPVIQYLHDVRMETRDGVELSADIWLPDANGPYPSILLRTPYTKSAGFLDNPNLGEFFASHGYALIVQDVRGKGLSGGMFGDAQQEPEDGYDSIEWIASQSWSNGRVCMMGLSYLGWVQWLAVKAKPPHLTCIVPTASPGNPFTSTPYQGGVFVSALISWAWKHTGAESLREKNPDWDTLLLRQPLNKLDQFAGQTLWLYQDWVNHPPGDQHWRSIMLAEEDYRDADLPTLTITGWYDDTMIGAMSHFYGMKKSPADQHQYLLIGPWNHAQTFVGGKTEMRGMTFSQDAVLNMRAVHLEFFEKYLKQEEKGQSIPGARVYVTGENRWHDLDTYPPSSMTPRRVFLSSSGRANSDGTDGKLVWEAPQAEPADVYEFDPKNPAPMHSADAFSISDQKDAEPSDSAERRDVLTYTSAPLEEPLTVLGPMTLVLAASSDSRDTDFVARLLDVAPDGRETKPVAVDGALRARYRHGFDKERLLTPGRVERFQINLADIGHQFQKGHRLRIEVTSSAFPVFHPNPNTGKQIATDTDYRIASQKIFHSGAHLSYLVLPVLPE